MNFWASSQVTLSTGQFSPQPLNDEGLLPVNICHCTCVTSYFAGRLYAEADGIEHVLVNGTPLVSDGALTDARTGTLLRSGRDTQTPSMQ